jgi:hypothetical protein
MAWAWAFVVIVAVGLPATAWWLSRNLKPPRQPLGGPGPRFDRVDRWLYDRYQLGVVDRWRVREAVLAGRELHEHPLREAAHSLAAEMLAGRIGGFYRRAGWIRIGSGLLVVVTAVVVAVIRIDYPIVVVALVGLPQLVLGGLYQKVVRERVERAHHLND